MHVKWTSFAAGIAVGAALAVAAGAVAQGRKIPEETAKQLRRLTEVYGAVKSNFAGPIDDAKLFDGCIAGLLRNLDPESAYYDRQEFEALKPASRNQRGAIGGVGIEMTSQNGRVAVVSPIEGSPADRAGILSGDLILRIEQLDTAAMTLSEAIKLLRGAPGSQLSLSLMRTGVTSPIEMQLTRELIRVVSVRGHLQAAGIGYVRVVQFRDETPELLLKTMERLKSENGGPLKGLIVDLRDNPGGLLQSGIAVAAAFLGDDVPIASTEGPSPESNHRFKANPLDYRGLPRDFRARMPEVATLPLVILVNGGSAAASEIVAASLQDHKRATIVGEKTSGRGSIQTILPFQDDTAIKITTAYWFAPSGKGIDKQGVTPNVWTNAASKGQMTRYGDASDEPVKRAVEVLKGL